MSVADLHLVRSKSRELILELMDDGASPQDIIEGFEEELDRFETLVFDYD